MLHPTRGALVSHSRTRNGARYRKEGPGCRPSTPERSTGVATHPLLMEQIAHGKGPQLLQQLLAELELLRKGSSEGQGVRFLDGLHRLLDVAPSDQRRRLEYARHRDKNLGLGARGALRMPSETHSTPRSQVGHPRTLRGRYILGTGTRAGRVHLLQRSLSCVSEGVPSSSVNKSLRSFEQREFT